VAPNAANDYWTKSAKMLGKSESKRTLFGARQILAVGCMRDPTTAAKSPVGQE
jgi:hypothetical protein